MVGMSYAKYLYTNHYKINVDNDYHIGHINGEKKK